MAKLISEEALALFLKQNKTKQKTNKKNTIAFHVGALNRHKIELTHYIFPNPFPC